MMGDLKYGDFEFPSDRGFSGSAGKSEVKGYMRGGRVGTGARDSGKGAVQNKSGRANYAKSKAKPSVGAMQGGHMKKAKGGPVGRGAKNVGKGGAKQKMPATVKARGGTVGVTTEKGPTSRRVKSTMTAAAQGGSVHDNLMAHGKRMGYAQGGYAKAKDTSDEFTMKSKPQDTMDSGTYPPQSSNQAEKEAGGRKRTKPKFATGGQVTDKEMQRAQRTKPRRARPNPDHTKGKGKTKKGMPKNVKARGGLAQYAEGGGVSAKDVPGSGGARRAADAIEARQRRINSTVNEAVRSQNRGPASQRPKRQTQDKPPVKKKPPGRIHREDEDGVPTFTDVPKYAGTKRRMSGGRVHRAKGGGVKK